MSHPTFNVPDGVSVAWSAAQSEYVVFHGTTPADARPDTIVMHHSDAVVVQRWLDAGGREGNPVSPSRSSAHGRRHNGPGLGAFVGSAGAVLAAAALGPVGYPAAALMSAVGGGIGGYVGSSEEQRKRGTLGGAAGGIFGPLFAALGGWLGGRSVDGGRKGNPQSIEDAIRSNPDVALSYNETLNRIEAGDVGIAAAWIGHMGYGAQADPEIQRISSAAATTLRASGVQIPGSSGVTLTRTENPGHHHDHDHHREGEWWLAEGHCCAACATDLPCSGDEGCELPSKPVKKNASKTPGRKKRR